MPVLTGPTLAPSPTPSPDAGNATFTLRFQGITSSRAEKSVRLTFKQGEAVIYSFPSITVSPGATDSYSGKVSGVNPGAYDVYVRGEAHLVRKFPDIAIETGPNSLDFTEKLLLAGDFDGDNIINVNDVGLLSARISAAPTTVDPSNRIFDVDANGVISSSDMDLVLSNYKGLEILGE